MTHIITHYIHSGRHAYLPSVSASFFVCSVAGAAAVSVVATAGAMDFAAADLGTATLPLLEDKETLEAAGAEKNLSIKKRVHLA